MNNIGIWYKKPEVFIAKQAPEKLSQNMLGTKNCN